MSSTYSSSPYHGAFIACAVFSLLSAIAAACGAALPWLTLNTGIGVELAMYPFRQCISTTILDSTNTVCGYLEFDLKSIVDNKYYAFFGGFASAVSVLFAVISFIISLGRWCGIVGVQWFLLFTALFQITAGILGVYWWWDLYRSVVGNVWSIGLYMVLVSLFFTLLGMLTVCLGACCVCCCRSNDTIEEYGSRKKQQRTTVIVNAASSLRDNEYGTGRKTRDPESDEENPYPKTSSSPSSSGSKGKRKASSSRAERVKSAQKSYQTSSATESTNDDDNDDPRTDTAKASSWSITGMFRSSGSKKTKKTKSSSSTDSTKEVTKNPVYQPTNGSNDNDTIPREPLSDEALLKRTLIMVGAVEGDVSSEEDMLQLIPRVQTSIEYIAEKSGTEMNERILNDLTIATMKAIFEATRVDLVRSRKWLTIVKNTVEGNNV